jgi:hypothetical protein
MSCSRSPASHGAPSDAIMFPSSLPASLQSGSLRSSLTAYRSECTARRVPAYGKPADLPAGLRSWRRGAVTSIARAAPAAAGCLTNRPESGPVAREPDLLARTRRPGNGLGGRPVMSRRLPALMRARAPRRIWSYRRPRDTPVRRVASSAQYASRSAGGSGPGGHPPPAGIWWFRVAAVT